MSKNVKRFSLVLMMTLLTGVVWLIWKIILPASREQFLNAASLWFEKTIFGDVKKRRSTYRVNYASSNN